MRFHMGFEASSTRQEKAGEGKPLGDDVCETGKRGLDEFQDQVEEWSWCGGGHVTVWDC